MSDYTRELPFEETEKVAADCACGRSPTGSGGLEYQGWRFIACASCGTYVLSPRPSEERMAAFYANAYDHAGGDTDFAEMLRIQRENPWVEAKNRGYLALLSDLARGSRLLDYGCGYGQFLAYARERFDCAGFELSPRGRKIVRDTLRLPVSDDLRELQGPGRISVITSFHVLEHLSRPRTVLRRFYDTLEPEGVLLLAVPNGNSLARRVLGAQWEWCAFPVHNYLFTKKGLAHLVSGAGFEILHEGTRIGNAPSPGALRRAIGRRLGGGGLHVNTNPGAVVAPSANYVAARKMYWRFVTDGCRALAPLGRALDRWLPLGDEIIVVARKPAQEPKDAP